MKQPFYSYPCLTVPRPVLGADYISSIRCLSLSLSLTNKYGDCDDDDTNFQTQQD